MNIKIIIPVPSFEDYVEQFIARRREIPTVTPNAVALRIISIYRSEGINIAHYYSQLKSLKEVFK